MDFSCILDGDSTFCMYSFSVFEVHGLVTPGSTAIQLVKYQWYVSKDHQHPLTIDLNLFSFSNNRWMELGMSDDLVFGNININQL